MFNLIVSGGTDTWEKTPFGMDADRFKEYSGSEGDGISLKDPGSLKSLEQVPALIMYELGSSGVNARLVRYGTLHDISVRGTKLLFRFEPHPDHGFLTRGAIQEFAAQLGMHSFEDHRTHWAVKDGSIPDDLIARGEPTPPVRDVSLVARELREAEAAKQTLRTNVLRSEFVAFLPSTDKAVEFLRSLSQDALALEAHPHLGTRQGTPDAHLAVKGLTGPAFESQLDQTPFGLVAFLELYASPTEKSRLDSAVERCGSILTQFLAQIPEDPASTETVATILTKCAQSATLSRRFRRTINPLVDSLAASQRQQGFWTNKDGNNDVRTTSIATVALQRLGNDKHRAAIGPAVLWISAQQMERGTFPHLAGEATGDVVATVFSLEAIRRSGLSEQLMHVLDAGESGIFGLQQPLGSWQAAGWADPTITSLVLSYFVRRSAMLPQVDGFFLMTRDFIRKAQELQEDAASNDRRIAAIASVHAMEMFLYGVFERREDLGLSAYKENGVETLGPREALAALQSRLLALGLLPEGRRLRYRDQLSALVGKRDAIIHRASEISSEELRGGMQAVERFVEEYGAQLVKLDLLQ